MESFFDENDSTHEYNSCRKCREYYRERWKSNKDKNKEINKRYYEKNKERIKERGRARYHKKKAEGLANDE